jgi:glycosyltransferase involved in cell wall biosynthesis
MLVKDSEMGGVGSNVASLAKGLQERKKAEVVIGISEGECIEGMLKGYDNHIIDFRSKNPFIILKNYQKILNLVREYHIEIIHAQNRIPALYAAVICFFNKKVRYIWSNHLVPIPSGLKYRLATKYGSCAVAEGISGEQMLINDFKIPKEKVEVINLGIDLSKFVKTSVEEQNELKKYWKIKKTDKVILLYGRLNIVKGHMFLLDALDKTENKRDFKIIFPGENEEYKVEILEKAKKYGFEKNIIFPGYIKGRDYLSISDLMVLPSSTEGFGIVNVESFCLDVPVIRTKTGGYEDMKDLVFGVKYGDIYALSNLLRKFFDEDECFKERARIAKENVGRFSLERMTDKYYKVYQSALMGR